MRTQVAQAALSNTISGGIMLRNTGDIAMAAYSVQGDISVVAENGFNGSAGGAITVGAIAGVSGIVTKSAGDVLVMAGRGGDDISGDGGAAGVITVNNPAIWRPILAMQDAVSAYVRAVEAPSAAPGANSN